MGTKSIGESVMARVRAKDEEEFRRWEKLIKEVVRQRQEKGAMPRF
jgi:hypothetical protein